MRKETTLRDNATNWKSRSNIQKESGGRTMNKPILLLIAFAAAFASIPLSADNAIKTTVLKRENRVDFMEKMESNDLFPERVSDIDVDNENTVRS
jgi:hypothetical protein